MSSSIADLAMLGRLFDEHRVKLLAMINRRLDPALRARVCSEDILQDAFEIAKSRWPEFQRRQQSASPEDCSLSPYSWLYRVSRDALINAWRKHSSGPRDVHREMPLPEGSAMQLGASLIDRGIGPMTEAHRNEIQEMVKQAVAVLKIPDQEILWMRFEDQLTSAEIADVLSNDKEIITENAVGVRYYRALRKFAATWKRMFPNAGSKP